MSLDRTRVSAISGKTIAHIRRQAADMRSALLILAAITGLVFGGLVVLRATTGIAIAEFTRDPLGYTEYPWYKGLVSNLGVIIWSATAGVCFFVWLLGSRSGRAREHARYLLAGGLVTVILLLDDLYMFHEVVFPEHLGIPEPTVYGTYLMLLLGFIARFQEIILRFDTPLFIAALFGFSTSMLADIAAYWVAIPGYYVIEDGGKFFGIVNWGAFLGRASARHLTSGGVASRAAAASR